MEVVLADETRYDDYGNFWFKDKEGKERKIGTKREDFALLCQLVGENPGRAVTLKFDHYMDKPYIVGVELLEIKVDEAKMTQQQVKPIAPKPTPQAKPEPKNRAFSLSYAKDIACAKIQMGGSMTPTEILHMAELFTSYLDSGLTKEAIKIYAQIQKELKKEE